MTQISNMEVIGLTVDYLKIVKLWRLSTEFYGVWQLYTSIHRYTEYTQVYMSIQVQQQ